MKILTARQIREADKYTIENEPISSVDLMERAAISLSQYILNNFKPHIPFYIFCGKGNNGGDGLALGRMLCAANRKVSLFVVEHSDGGSEDFNVNLERYGRDVHQLKSIEDLPKPEQDVIIVDALLGSGLNRPLDGVLADVVKELNRLRNFRLAIDIPTGLFADDNEGNDRKKIFRADLTLSLQQPKLSFFHRDTALFIGGLKVLDIGLSRDFLNDVQTHHHFVTAPEILEIYKPRSRFSYKNSHGHLLLVGGSRGKTGAVILSASAAMRSGAGLVTVHTSKAGLVPLQSYIPEVMVSVDNDKRSISELPDLDAYSSIAAGPGIGTEESTQKLIKQLIQNCRVPLILDADALNILALNRTWLAFLPKGTILTPHIGEFKKLLDKKELGSDYLEEARQFALKHQITLVLKDSITAISAPNGHQFFIDIGSPALATAGSGDVLTGIISALAAGSYSPLEAALLGVWIHADGGRRAGEDIAIESVIAGDLPDYIAAVFQNFNRS